MLSRCPSHPTNGRIATTAPHPLPFGGVLAQPSHTARKWKRNVDPDAHGFRDSYNGQCHGDDHRYLRCAHALDHNCSNRNRVGRRWTADCDL